jgi:hypothetical protein
MWAGTPSRLQSKLLDLLLVSGEGEPLYLDGKVGDKAVLYDRIKSQSRDYFKRGRKKPYTLKQFRFVGADLLKEDIQYRSLLPRPVPGARPALDGRQELQLGRGRIGRVPVLGKGLLPGTRISPTRWESAPIGFCRTMEPGCGPRPRVSCAVGSRAAGHFQRVVRPRVFRSPAHFGSPEV